MKLRHQSAAAACEWVIAVILLRKLSDVVVYFRLLYFYTRL